MSSAVKGLDEETLARKHFGEVKAKNQRDLKLTEPEARSMLRLLSSQLNISPRVVFSSRMKNLQGACYQRPIILLLPNAETGELTEERVLHEVAHVLDLEHHRIKPHSNSFRNYEQLVEGVWYGR